MKVGTKIKVCLNTINKVKDFCQATMMLPADIAVGQYRLRIRVTETNTLGAEDDVIGACYDFIVSVVPAETAITWSVESNDENRGTAQATEESGVLKLSATPKGDATFVGWKLMDSYFTGHIVDTEAETELPLTQSMRLVAVFSPNMQELSDDLPTLKPSSFTPASGRYDLSGRRIPTSSVSPVGFETPKGVYIVNGKKQIITR